MSFLCQQDSSAPGGYQWHHAGGPSQNCTVAADLSKTIVEGDVTLVCAQINNTYVTLPAPSACTSLKAGEKCGKLPLYVPPAQAGKPCDTSGETITLMINGVETHCTCQINAASGVAAWSLAGSTTSTESLPTTGANTLLIATAGTGMALAGAGAYWIVRRRRMRFVA